MTPAADIFRLLQTAARQRATAATKMNERSSRSHSVFTLRITGGNAATGQRSSGVLNLIDLAGSERLQASGVTGDRLKACFSLNPPARSKYRGCLRARAGGTANFCFLAILRPGSFFVYQQIFCFS